MIQIKMRDNKIGHNDRVWHLISLYPNREYAYKKIGKMAYLFPEEEYKMFNTPEGWGIFLGADAPPQ